MGGTELALNQIGPHLRKIEQSFSSMYQDFLEENAEDLFHPADIYGSTIVRLETLLQEMGHEIAEAGMPEAKNVVQEIVEKQNRISRYLLNSTYGSVWTIELPPFLLHEVEETLLPTFFVEDFAITDLYGEAEEFKKCTIYGLDSLSKFSAQNRAYLQEVLKNPEEHQLVTCFEPIKSRLLFAGRSEQIEKDIPRFSTLFVNQAWSGYLDNLLGETNLTLSTLRHPPTLDPGDLETMKDGELFVLNKNLSMLSTCEKTVKRALDESDQFVEQMKQDIDGLKRYFEENKSYEIGLFNALFAINKENLGRLPRRLTKFRREFQRITVSVGKVIDRVQKEYHKKKPDVRKKRRRILYISPVVALLSVLLVLTNLYLPKGILATSCLVAAVIIQVIYWVFYYLRLRRLQNAGRYPSRSFVEQQLFVLAFAQALYKFIAAYNVIGPAKEDNSQISRK